MNTLRNTLMLMGLVLAFVVLVPVTERVWSEHVLHRLPLRVEWGLSLTPLGRVLPRILVAAVLGALVPPALTTSRPLLWAAATGGAASAYAAVVGSAGLLEPVLSEKLPAYQLHLIPPVFALLGAALARGLVG